MYILKKLNAIFEIFKIIIYLITIFIEMEFVVNNIVCALLIGNWKLWIMNVHF